jgi:bla regulator protein blaR1
MTDMLLRMLAGVTLGLALSLLLRRPARRLFGAGPAFTLWLLPVVLACAPFLPRGLAPAVLVLHGMTVTPQAAPLAAARHVVVIDWAHMLIAAWLLGVTSMLARLAFHYLRLLQGARIAPSAWTCALREAAPDIDPLRVRVHDAGPAVLWALPRSLILLPADFARRFDNAATRELVLRHEMTHVSRGDAWWSLAMEIASALLWLHPLVWMARSRFRLDQELACDAASLRTLPRRTSNYARALVDSVAVQPVSALIPWLAEPQLKERIVMITRIPPGALRRRLGFVAIAALLAGGLFIAGGQTPVRAAAHATSASTPPSVDISFKNRNPPLYPVEAIKKGEQGMVILDVTVDAHGNVTGVAVAPRGTMAPAVLQSAAVAAAANWKFNPGTKHGHAVGGVVRIPMNFSLDGGGPVADHHCPVGFKYKQETKGSFSCTASSASFKRVNGTLMMKAGKGAR